jgi:hypothetical protein
MSAEDLVITEVAIHPAEGGQGANPPGMIMLDRPAPTRHRKLHLGHFAVMRAVVQGLDTHESWNRYLRIEGERDDIRNVRRTRRHQMAGKFGGRAATCRRCCGPLAASGSGCPVSSVCHHPVRVPSPEGTKKDDRPPLRGRRQNLSGLDGAPRSGGRPIVGRVSILDRSGRDRRNLHAGQAQAPELSRPVDP